MFHCNFLLTEKLSRRQRFPHFPLPLQPKHFSILPHTAAHLSSLFLSGLCLWCVFLQICICEARGGVVFPSFYLPEILSFSILAFGLMYLICFYMWLSVAPCPLLRGPSSFQWPTFLLRERQVDYTHMGQFFKSLSALLTHLPAPPLVPTFLATATAQQVTVMVRPVNLTKKHLGH